MNLRKALRFVLAGLLVWYLLCLPGDLFSDTPYSTVVTDCNGELLGARIASDGQWRFPPSDDVPDKYAKAVIEFEDRHFKWHPGVNPVSIFRAAKDNIRAGHVTSGGSTITMQVIRLSRNKERTFRQKLTEAILATRLELRCSKKEILAMYASHAPFGGNVVGLEAASWRYFSRPPEDLSWAEAAVLAVLPNSPSSIHPGKNREKLLEKRNRLLERLSEKGYIDPYDCLLACEEPLPEEPRPLPSYASHLTEYYGRKNPGTTTRTSISLDLQKQLEGITDRWNEEFSLTGVNDLAAVIIDVRTGELLAYCGNANINRARPGVQVDIARSPRSTGSILKPFLYCALLQEGQILPDMLVPDTPLNINGFTPQNFDRQFNGAVPASEALARSLNVPAVHMLRMYGVPKFHSLLKECGMTTLTRSAGNYGLSLILGGGEGSLLEITAMYAALSRTYQSVGKQKFPLNDKAALWHTLEALKEVNRPDEMDWRMVSSLRKVAWKTGTSYGFRDAWAVGVTPDYAVGVWAGNANGEGVAGITGARTAGPVMFDIFNVLPAGRERKDAYVENGWFLEPAPGDGILAEVCRRSGHLKGVDCPECDTLMLPKNAILSDVCPYHKLIDGESEFILPPAMEWYYRQHHPEYHPAQAARKSPQAGPMAFIYPDNGSTVYIPRTGNSLRKGVVFNLAHRDNDIEVFWHLDNEYLGSTKNIHQMMLSPEIGKHTVTVVDEQGNTLSVGFTVADGN